MARHEGEFEAAGEARLDLDELLAMRPRVKAGGCKRREAIARFLSASEGWRDAAATLGGTFAGTGGAAGLTGDKE